MEMRQMRQVCECAYIKYLSIWLITFLISCFVSKEMIPFSILLFDMSIGVRRVGYFILS